MPAGSSAAKAYARALHDLARERNQAEAVGRELETVASLIADHHELCEFFTRPWVAASAKRAAAVEVATRLGVSALVRDFLGLVARHGRGDHLEAIVTVYRGLVDESLGRVRARVRTAVPLSDGERRALSERLARVMGGKHVLLEEQVDHDLLGGFVAEIGSYIVDGSLEGQLARIHDRLARG